MTVIACYQTKDHYWIASDSTASADDFATDLGPKVFQKNNYIVGWAISPRAGDIVRELERLPEDIKCLQDFRDFRDVVMLAMIEEGGCSIDAEQGETFKHPLELLVISSYGMWYMGPDYQLIEIKEGYCAIGSGEVAAIGSLFTSTINKQKDGQKAVKTACSAAIRHINSCGGNVYVMSLERKRRSKS